MGGLGFGLKWDMGWMHDTLKYMSEDPIHRKYHHSKITFRMLYAWHENFVLPLSHDEVVHGKGSLIGKMAGDGWDEFANLRLLFGYMYGQAAKKLLFMGGEIGQRAEWNHDASLQWELLEHESHAGIQRWVRDLNWLYRSEPALHELDCEPDGFQWVDCNDAEQSLLSFLRRGRIDRRHHPGGLQLSLRCRGTATASGFPVADVGRRSSTPTLTSTGARDTATSAEWRPPRCRATAIRSRWR